MGFYAKHVLPRLLDLAMKNPDATRLRAERIAQAEGDVLEVGIGSGLNLPFYSSQVQRVYGLDPSVELQRIALRRMTASPLTVDFFTQSAETPVPLPGASIDTVVSTWSLCSIPDAQAALQNVRRVLKPGGSYLFIEHGRAGDSSVAAWQDRLTPAWKRIAGRCRLNCRIDELVANAGFEIIELNRFYLPGPRPMTYTYQGRARVR